MMEINVCIELYSIKWQIREGTLFKLDRQTILDPFKGQLCNTFIFFSFVFNVKIQL